MENPAIAMPAIIQDLHIQPEHGLFRPFQDLHEQTATADQDASDAGAWIISLRGLQDVPHLFIRYPGSGLADIEESNHGGHLGG